MDISNVTPVQVLDWVEKAVLVATILSPFIPNPQYNAYLIAARKVLDILAFNFKNAKNIDAPK